MADMGTIRARRSVRSYRGEPIAGDALRNLRAAVDDAARESGLNIQLVMDNPEVFDLVARFGLIHGATAHIDFIVSGGPDPALDERIGYWGQRIVLEAQDMGLNTCWCGMFARRKSRAELKPGERIRIVIAVGYGQAAGKPRKTKPFDELAAVEGDGKDNGAASAPDWFCTAVEAAQLAPTAMNNQHFHLTLSADGQTLVLEAPTGGFNRIDAGIVRCNIETVLPRQARVLVAGAGSMK